MSAETYYETYYAHYGCTHYGCTYYIPVSTLAPLAILET